MRKQGVGARRLARLGAADLDHAAPGRDLAKVVVVADDAVHLGPRQVERRRNLRQSLARHMAERLLHAVQDGQERAGQVRALGDDLADDVDCGVAGHWKNLAALSSVR